MKRLKDVMIAIGILAVALLIFKDLLPPIFSTKRLEEKEISADVDIPVVVRVKGGMLEVASIKGRRHFPGASDPTIFGKSLPFCREFAGWTVAYKITYRVKLGEKWSLRYQNGVLFARVPELQPSLPVAIDTKTLTATGREKCWFMMDLGTRDRVLKGISPELEKFALRPATKKFARSAAEATIKEFLRTWVFNQKEYPGIAPDTPVKLQFAGD